MRCVIDGCDRKAQSRGLCHSCYLTALRLVQAGETTWDALEHADPPLCGPLMKTPNAFAAAYAKLPPVIKDLPGQTRMFADVEEAEIHENIPNFVNPLEVA